MAFPNARIAYTGILLSFVFVADKRHKRKLPCSFYSCCKLSLHLSGDTGYSARKNFALFVHEAGKDFNILVINVSYASRFERVNSFFSLLLFLVRQLHGLVIFTFIFFFLAEFLHVYIIF